MEGDDMTPAEKLHDAAARFLFMTRTTLAWETESRRSRFETLATEFKEALKAFEDAEGITAKRQALREGETFNTVRVPGGKAWEQMTLSEFFSQ